MAVPKKKTSRMRRGMRRSHQALTAARPLTCAHCGEARVAHRACPSCGHYRHGVEIPVPQPS